MTYRELYQSLFDAYVVSSFYLHSPNGTTQMLNARHSIENCTAFKKLIERFIKMGIVRFDDPSGPNVVGNLLHSHSDKGVNTIIEIGGKRTKMNVAELKTPLKWVWKKMVEGRLIKQDSEERPKRMRNYCEFHAEEGHEIQECVEFRALVQNLIDNKELEFFEYAKGLEGKDV
ncbi:hypothetical protein EPI10_028786 [Gossypium australe]|uniref:Retrotransposon gag domain-containing protein n=1 Tax=Gossypium australe TaxID=47621 RepID=A0A5B6UZB1_9ROSI|nr:hypothetical protein EPI10_028786 [Gossypium australe]